MTIFTGQRGEPIMRNIPDLPDKASEGITHARAYFTSLMQQGIADVSLNDPRAMSITTSQSKGFVFKLTPEPTPMSPARIVGTGANWEWPQST